jgi:ubiquinone/menaquinone biosynthesis C-methylase UbiE
VRILLQARVCAFIARVRAEFVFIAGEPDMAERVCPWWLGYFLASPVRKWMSDDPVELLAPFVRPGMTVLEPGPGMGFFTLPMARMVGPAGRVIAVDIQPRMLSSLSRRARKAGLSARIETRLARSNDLGLHDLAGAMDFALAFAVVHETPSAETFFAEILSTLKPEATLFFAEPAGHVSQESFELEVAAAEEVGFKEIGRRSVHHIHAAVLHKS